MKHTIFGSTFHQTFTGLPNSFFTSKTVLQAPKETEWFALTLGSSFFEVAGDKSDDDDELDTKTGEPGIDVKSAFSEWGEREGDNDEGDDEGDEDGREGVEGRAGAEREEEEIDFDELEKVVFVEEGITDPEPEKLDTRFDEVVEKALKVLVP